MGNTQRIAMGKSNKEGCSTGETGKKKVFLVDDHSVVRLGVTQVIDRQGDLIVCGEAETAEEALKMIPETMPDIVILDLTLKESSGLELLKDLKIQQPKLPVLVLSMHSEVMHAEMALRNGARGYIMKSDSTDLMLRAIRKVLAGSVYVSETIASRLLQQQVLGRGGPLSAPEERLSDRELEVLQLLGEWKSTKEVAKELSLSVKTVEYYREQIKEKLNLKNANELRQYAVLRNQERAQTKE